MPAREVRSSDFGDRARIRMYFPKEGSQLTPPHCSIDFYWKDYCPMVFRYLLTTCTPEVFMFVCLCKIRGSLKSNVVYIYVYVTTDREILHQLNDHSSMVNVE